MRSVPGKFAFYCAAALLVLATSACATSGRTPGVPPGPAKLTNLHLLGPDELGQIGANPPGAAGAPGQCAALPALQQHLGASDLAVPTPDAVAECAKAVGPNRQ